MQLTKEKALMQQGMLDELTGIYNRKGFYKYTRKLLEEYPEKQFCLIYLDIRKFKVINELFGREVGDKTLIHMAVSIKERLKNEVATYARLERDNFICCVEETMINEDKGTRKGDFSYFAENYEYNFFSCYGLYKIKDPNLPIASMADKARVAMETVKDNYVTPYAWYNESMWGSIVEEQQMNSDFRKAIDEKQFKVYYQPICRTSDGMVTGAEALVRWQQPGKGLISPAKFIPVFEKNGFISVLDRYVWNEVCRMISERLKKGLSTVPISINVSRVEFFNHSLCEDIRDIVRKYDIPNDMVKIEVTESAYTDDPIRIQEIIDKFHEYGFIVLMDDFGSGYSSLNTLKDLNIDILKIDMKFMDDFEQSKKASIILEAVIRMAKWMRLKVVAEGVETKNEWDYLNSVECDLVQGYYFYKPMPEEDFINLLEETAKGKGQAIENMEIELEDVILDAFRRGNSKESTLFYSMLGGMGIFEMTQDNLEIIQVNRGYYEEIYNCAHGINEETKIINQFVEEPERSILMKKCNLAKEKNKKQHLQLHHKREDGTYVWLSVKIRYIGSCGKRSLFYFAIENIDEVKKAEYQRYLSNYSDALIRVYDKVYQLNYNDGMAEVLHTCGKDGMQIGAKYYFRDFFEKNKKFIKWKDNKDLSQIILNKNLMDIEIGRSKNASFSAQYTVEQNSMIISQISVLIFKVEVDRLRQDYLCCIKKD